MAGNGSGLCQTRQGLDAIRQVRRYLNGNSDLQGIQGICLAKVRVWQPFLLGHSRDSSGHNCM